MYAEMCDLTLVGLIGICDPPRPDVSPSISIIRRAGVRVFMVTGDFKLTALAIARQVVSLFSAAMRSLLTPFSGWYHYSARRRHHPGRPSCCI